MNKATLIGRLGRDPETRQTAGGQVCNFTLATTERFKDRAGERQEQTEWHKCTVFGAMADVCQRFLQKGKQVAVEGRLQTRKWQDKDGNARETTEVLVQHMELLGDRKPPLAEPGPVAEEDIPF